MSRTKLRGSSSTLTTPGPFAPIRHLTVGGFRDFLLADTTDTQTLTHLSTGLTPEMVAAVSKLMRNQDLITVSAKCEVITKFRSTIVLRVRRLSTRLQPNHPTDDARGIAPSLVDGLLYGSGDAVIGINPATDHVPTTIRLLAMVDAVRESGSPSDAVVRAEPPDHHPAGHRTGRAG